MGATPILVNYRTQGEDWTVDVRSEDTVLTEQAPGLIAARDRADQMVEQLTDPESERKPTVVHLLDGDAFAFTTAYLHARHGLSAKAPVIDAPVIDAPVIDGPGIDAPVVKAPGIDTVIDTPAVDKPAAGENTQEMDLSELADDPADEGN